MKHNYLVHSAKGQTWRNHKYIAIKNGRYIYPGDETEPDSSVFSKRHWTDEQGNNYTQNSKFSRKVNEFQVLAYNGFRNPEQLKIYKERNNIKPKYNAGKEISKGVANVGNRAIAINFLNKCIRNGLVKKENVLEAPFRDSMHNKLCQGFFNTETGQLIVFYTLSE